jgi:PIN domain nuclease of toxin-antitoxin system
MSTVLDTHAVLWYLLDAQKLPAKVFALIDGAAAG